LAIVVLSIVFPLFRAFPCNDYIKPNIIGIGANIIVIPSLYMAYIIPQNSELAKNFLNKFKELYIIFVLPQLPLEFEEHLKHPPPSASHKAFFFSTLNNMLWKHT